MSSARRRPSRNRRVALMVAALTACAASTTTIPSPTSASATLVVTVDGAAVGGAPATRGTRVQLEPAPPPPLHYGCLVGTVSRVSTTVDAAQRWWNGTVWGDWRSALAPVGGVRGPVVVVGDSLTMGSIEETMRRLLDAGFGPVCIDGAVSRRMTVGAGGPVSSAVEVIARIRASDPVWATDVVRWVLAIGTNDARPTNTSSWPTTIAAGRTAVGATRHPLYLVDIRTRRDEVDPIWRTIEDRWNTLLSAAGTVVVRWSSAVAARPADYIVGGTDWVHLRPAGDDLRAATIVAALTAG